MTTKSRLGRGLGALFPSLPGHEEESHTQPTSTHDEQPTGVTSPLSSTIPSMGTMERHAETVSKLAAPLTLQPEAAVHRPVQEKPQAQTSSQEAAAEPKKASRAAMPSIKDMAHPSDMFFDGTPIIEQNKAADKSEKDTSKIELKPVEGGYLAELKVSQIGPNLYQPRTVFDEEELQELAQSIKEVGILQPIVVRKRPRNQQEHAKQPYATHNYDERFQTRMDSEYELVMGERRWRASQLAGLKTIPAIVKTTADDVMLRDALLENLHRVALNPLEEAAAYQQMIDEFGLTQLQLSKSVSKSRPQIANTLRLMNLPAAVQKQVAAGLLSAGHARALLGLPEQSDMIELAQRIIDEGLSVRSTEEIVSMKAAQKNKPKVNRHNPWAGSPMQQGLEQRFSTKVSIKGTEQHGRIEIVFSSPEDMERIVGLLMPEQ